MLSLQAAREGEVLAEREKGLAGGGRAGESCRGPPALPVRQGTGSLTRGFPCHVHSHGDSKAKTQVDTEVAPNFVS